MWQYRRLHINGCRLTLWFEVTTPCMISLWYYLLAVCLTAISLIPQIAKFMGPTWGPPGSCRPQMGHMLAPRTFLSGTWQYMNCLGCPGARITISLCLPTLHVILQHEYCIQLYAAFFYNSHGNHFFKWLFPYIRKPQTLRKGTLNGFSEMGVERHPFSGVKNTLRVIYEELNQTAFTTLMSWQM